MTVPAVTTEIAALLAGVPLLAGLPGPRLAELAAAARPVTVRAGELLFRRGEPGESLFVVCTGRVEVLVGDEVVRVHGRGEALGELALLTGGLRTATVRARRDTELLELHRTDVDALMAAAPAFAAALVRELARRLPGAAVAAAPATRPGVVLALVAVQPGLAPVVTRLAQLLVAELGPAAARLDDDGAAAGWAERLDAVERRGVPVLLVAPEPDGAWARFCLRQADRPLVVADPRRAPDGPELPPGARLVALGTAGLRRWLDAVEPAAHHVVGVAQGEVDREDVARLARRVTGRAVGIVLSGGGARGLAHIGVLDELLRAGLRLDRVGGTSMGSLVGGLFATGRSPAELEETARCELVPRRLFGDVAWPRHSLIRGRRAELVLARLFGGALVEDQRLRYFAVSVDLVAAERVVHRRGPIADAVALSVRIPGVVPPRRVGDRLHVDGGVLDNMPVAEMSGEQEGPVLAVDVGQPFDAAPGRLPSLVDTIGRSMMVAGNRRDDPERLLAHTVLTPRLDGLGLFDFGRLTELVDRGREAARDALPRLRDLIEQ